MAATDLEFSQSPLGSGSPVEIVFGDDSGAPAGTGVLHIAGSITGLRGHITARTFALANAAGSITGLRGHVVAHHDINVSRPLARAGRDAWQPAAPLRAGTQLRFEQARAIGAALRAQWQHSAQIGAALRAQWQATDPVQRATRLQYQQAMQLATAPTRQQFEQAGHIQQLRRQQYQQARSLAASPVQQRFEDAERLRRLVRQQYQRAVPLAAAIAQRFGIADHLGVVRRAQYQQARKPLPGVTAGTKPPAPDPCYVPKLPAELVFDLAADAVLPVDLVFVCERHGPGPGPDPEPPQYVIPLLEVYVSLHTLNAVLLPSLEPVALLDATIESDDGGFGWALTANGPEHLLDQLAPVSGLPARVCVTIDGIDWVFAVERVSRTRRFGQHRTSIQGRSVTALLADPYMPQQSWLNAGNLTAQQIVAQALEFTGTTIAWGIDDWLVPGGAWSFTGTPLQAALRVAESVGAVVRSHRTDAQLIYAPRYPALPWAWGGAMVNVQMPAAIITTDSLEPDPRPAYNAVYVGGMAQGVLGQVRRTGTAGDLLAPQVTDALITQEVAARQRGSAVLGGAGNKLTHTMTLPLLTGGTNPGLIQPGYLIEVNDIGHTWRGLVRGIRITAGMPIVRQTITVERNA